MMTMMTMMTVKTTMPAHLEILVPVLHTSAFMSATMARMPPILELVSPETISNMWWLKSSRKVLRSSWDTSRSSVDT